MSLTPREIKQLRSLVAIAQKILELAEAANGRSVRRGGPARVANQPKRRRSGKELLAFRKLLMSERKRGVPVAEIAKRHGISTAYIYQLK